MIIFSHPVFYLRNQPVCGLKMLPVSSGKFPVSYAYLSRSTASPPLIIPFVLPAFAREISRKPGLRLGRLTSRPADNRSPRMVDRASFPRGLWPPLTEHKISSRGGVSLALWPLIGDMDWREIYNLKPGFGIPKGLF